MVVVGASAKVKEARDDILEFLLTSHPLDCPVCDKGGECPLQDLTMRYGPGGSRFIFDEKVHLDKHVPLGEPDEPVHPRLPEKWAMVASKTRSIAAGRPLSGWVAP